MPSATIYKPKGTLSGVPEIVVVKAMTLSSLWSRCFPTDCPTPATNCLISYFGNWLAIMELICWSLSGAVVALSITFGLVGVSFEPNSFLKKSAITIPFRQTEHRRDGLLSQNKQYHRTLLANQ